MTQHRGSARNRLSPVSLQRQTAHAADPETLGTWQLWICPGWDQKQTGSRNTPSTAAVEGVPAAFEVLMPEQDDTHKQLARHDDSRLLRVNVELDNISIPGAIQQLIVCR